MSTFLVHFPFPFEQIGFFVFRLTARCTVSFVFILNFIVSPELTGLPTHFAQETAFVKWECPQRVSFFLGLSHVDL